MQEVEREEGQSDSNRSWVQRGRLDRRGLTARLWALGFVC